MADFDMTTGDADIVGVDNKVEPKTENTVLDSLRSELQRTIQSEPITLVVPSRPGMAIVFDTNIEANQLQFWRKACQDKQMVDNFDGLKFSAIIIANQATRILVNNEVAVDEDNNELNFRNRKFTDMLGANRATQAVRKLYGMDGHIFIAADQILRAAGYDSDESQEAGADPTLVT